MKFLGKVALLVLAGAVVSVLILLVFRPLPSRADASLVEERVREILSGIPAEPTLEDIERTLPPRMTGWLTGARSPDPLRGTKEQMEEMKTPRGGTDLECRLLRLSLLSYQQVGRWHNELVIPTDEQGLFANPLLLWRPRSLRFREVRELASREMGPSRDAWGRFLSETVPKIGATISPGDVVVFKEPGYGTVIFPGAFVLCKGDTENVMAGVFRWGPAFGGETELGRLDERRAWYWTNIYYLQLQNAVGIYAKRNGGRLPTTRAQIAEVVGPENPAAWPKPVAMFVESVLPRLTTALESPPP